MGGHKTEVGNEALLKRPRAEGWRAFEVALRPAGTRKAPDRAQGSRAQQPKYSPVTWQLGDLVKWLLLFWILVFTSGEWTNLT